MNRNLVGSLAALALMAAMPASAQRVTPTIVRITPYAGYMAFGSLADGPLGTSIGPKASPVYGVELGLDLSKNLAIVGNVGYSDSDIEVGIPIIGGISIADSKVLMYDAGLQLRLPVVTALGSGMAPYLQAGAGAIRYDVSAGPIQTQATNLAGNFGGGVDMQLSRNLGLRLMAKDYVGKFDFKEATQLFDPNNKTSHNWLFGAGLNLSF
jgi:hypothetical protein